jgi:hypothetical protein
VGAVLYTTIYHKQKSPDDDKRKAEEEERRAREAAVTAHAVEAGAVAGATVAAAAAADTKGLAANGAIGVPIVNAPMIQNNTSGIMMGSAGSNTDPQSEVRGTPSGSPQSGRT